MKLLLIWSAADWSTYDVSAGYNTALRALHHDVQPFMLNHRLDFWSDALNLWADKHDQPQPDIASVCQLASFESLIRAGVHQSDVILLTCGMGFHPDALVLLRNHGYPIALICSESPYNDKEHAALAPLVDFIFTNDQASVAPLSVHNPRTFYLPTAYNPAVHSPLSTITRPSNLSPAPYSNVDVLFVGTGFPERQTFLEAAVTDPAWPTSAIFQIFGFFNWAGNPAFDMNAPDPDPANAPDYTLSPLTPYLHDPITNDETAYRYAHAKIVLNFYRQDSAYSLNPRAYEIAACHTFQLAQDSVPEAHSLFGDSIGYFSTPHDLATQVAYYLDPRHENLRNLKAESAFHRVHNRHSYLNRSMDLIRILEEHGVGKTTPTSPADIDTSAPSPAPLISPSTAPPLSFGTPLR